MESLPLKVPDFGLQMPTGPSSGVVACIFLVSSRLDCPGISLAEVCATCLEMSMWSFSDGMTLKCCSSKNFFLTYPIILMSNKPPFHALQIYRAKTSLQKNYCLQNGNG